MIPYLLWGVHMLRLRLTLDHELKPITQVKTLAALLVFFIVQYWVLSMWLSRTPGFFTLAVLGLFASGIALYGHMILSVGSLMLVDVMMPTAESDGRTPQYGAGEALERQGDYAGAVREYTAIAHLFPQDSTAALRVADNLMKLSEAEDAAHWFERGLRYVYNEQSALPITNRLSEILSRQLNRPDEAKKILEDFLGRFPESEYCESVRFRIERLRELSESAMEQLQGLSVSEAGSDDSTGDESPPASDPGL